MILQLNILNKYPVSLVYCPHSLTVLLRLQGGLPTSGESSILSWNFRHQHFVFFEAPWQDAFSGSNTRRKMVLNIRSKKVLAKLDVLKLRKRRQEVLSKAGFDKF